MGSGQDDAEIAADAEDRRHQADAPRDPLGRKLVADDPEGEGEDATARALDDAADDHHLDRGR
jgi:hypothetical protein